MENAMVADTTTPHETVDCNHLSGTELQTKDSQHRELYHLGFAPSSSFLSKIIIARTFPIFEHMNSVGITNSDHSLFQLSDSLCMFMTIWANSEILCNH